MGKVPALEDGRRASAIRELCIYIADQYPQSKLGPPVGHPERARFLQWVVYTLGRASSRRLSQDPAVPVRILESREASPRLLLDFGELQTSFR